MGGQSHTSMRDKGRLSDMSGILHKPDVDFESENNLSNELRNNDYKQAATMADIIKEGMLKMLMDKAAP